MSQDSVGPWRVYKREWLFESRHEGWDDARDVASARFFGRLRPEDVKVEPDDRGRPCVWTRRWNVSAEYKHEEHAREHAQGLTHDDGLSQDDVRIVERNSRDEQALRSYGVLRVGEGSQP